MTNQPRRFPPPWDLEDNGACFIVRDANGQAQAAAGDVVAVDEPLVESEMLRAAEACGGRHGGRGRDE
jgi:hypothetical protein